ncbi:MAG: hypothetical protein IT350_07895 [Deltaproteobacteria bacterium]|nr:hypothetical protein [Deltaproteobacteria bacterium]
MSAIQMVKCYLTRKSDEEGDVRYVPLEIFKMWRFLMERVHHLVVVSAEVSSWMDVDEYRSRGGELAEHSPEPVIQVRFDYVESGGVTHPVVRYFPEDNFDVIYGYFRHHFSDEHIMEDVRRLHGQYLGGPAAVPYIG